MINILHQKNGSNFVIRYRRETLKQKLIVTINFGIAGIISGALISILSNYFKCNQLPYCDLANNMRYAVQDWTCYYKHNNTCLITSTFSELLYSATNPNSDCINRGYEDLRKCITR